MCNQCKTNIVFIRRTARRTEIRSSKVTVSAIGVPLRVQVDMSARTFSFENSDFPNATPHTVMILLVVPVIIRKS